MIDQVTSTRKFGIGSVVLALLSVFFAAPVFATNVDDLLQMRESFHPNGSADYIDLSELQGRAAIASGNAADRALRIAEYLKQRLGISDPRRDLSVASTRTDLAGNTHVRLNQRHRGLRVDGAELIVHFNRDSEPTSLNATVVPRLALGNVRPAITGRAAAQLAIADVGDVSELSVSDVQLVIYNDGLVRGRAGTSHLAYKVTVIGAGVREFVYVGAKDGVIVDRFNGIHSTRNRLTYDMNGNSNYGAADLERTENDPPVGDMDVDNAHDFAGDTYDLFANGYGRDSIDDAGFSLQSYTHYFSFFICPNAFWDGIRMTYCDGFPVDDVTGHEITHGVIEFTADLVYQDQPGALNESLADIFGEMIDQVNGAGTDTAAVKWLVGEDIPGFGAIRDMADPPTFGDPDRVNSPNYHCTPDDNGGVHTNSGVPNKNFSLLTDGGTFNGRVVEPLGLTKTGAIHYQALTNYLGVNTQFPGYMVSLFRACRDLIGVELSDLVSGQPSGEIINFPDCVNVLRSGLAVQFLAPVCS